MPRTIGKALADTRSAIIRKIRAMKRTYPYNEGTALGALEALAQWISEMDERALTRKGGSVRPWRPVRKVPNTGLKKLKSK